MAKMIQEGFVLDLPNTTGGVSVSGELMYSLGFVGLINEGNTAVDEETPTIVNGVVEAAVTAGVAALERGSRLNLNTATRQLVLATATDEDADGDEDDLVFFGTVTRGRLPANTPGRLWIKIKPQ